MLKSALSYAFRFGPLLFGVGFIAPVIAAMAGSLGYHEVFGAPALYTGLAIGLGWGVIATARGSWI